MSIDLDLNAVAPAPEDIAAEEIKPLPRGKYLCRIEDAHYSSTRAGDTQVSLTWVVEEGPHKNRKVWDSYLVVHVNADAQRIGRERYASCVTACGFGKKWPQSPTEIIGRRVICGVTIEVDKGGQYPDRNRVGYCLAADSAPSSSGGAKSASTDYDDVPF